MTKLPVIELKVRDLEMVQEAMRQAMDSACYDALAGTSRIPESCFRPILDWRSKEFDWDTSKDIAYYKSRKVNEMKSVYQVWVVDGDEILVNGESVVSTSNGKAILKVVYALENVEPENLDMHAKRIFDLKCCE